MFEKYKKEIKKYDYQLRIDIVFKIVFIITLVIADLIIHYLKLHYLLKLLIILGIEVFAIILGLTIIFLWNVYNKFKTNEKNPFKRFKLFVESESNNRFNFVIELLKAYNITTPEKIIYMTNFYNIRNQKFNFTESQSIFGLFLIFLGVGVDFYNTTLNGLDEDKLLFSLSFAFVIFVIYGTIKLIAYIFRKIFLSTKEDIYEKFMNTLNYFYLNYEEYENKLKNNVK